MKRVQHRERQRAGKGPHRKPLPRRVHIDGREWSYMVTGHMVAVRDPDHNATIKTSHAVFTGLSWDCLERLGWKNRGYRITPQDIVDFVKNGFEPVKYKDNLYRFAVGPIGDAHREEARREATS